MSELQRVILHLYPNSPFAEKIRLIFGSKRLRWTSVQIPARLGFELRRIGAPT